MERTNRPTVLTIDEAAKYLRVSRSMLYNRYSELPHYRVGRRILFTEETLRKFMTEENGQVNE